MKEIFALSAGEYSDYSVLCVFDDEETAKAFLEAYTKSERSFRGPARIEKMLFYTKGEQPREQTTYRGEATLWDDGSVKEPRFWDYTEMEFDSLNGPLPERPIIDYCRAPILNDKGGFLRVHGKDAESVRKIVSDRVAAFKARSWIPQGTKLIPSS